MSIVLKDPFRRVVLDEEEERINLKQAPMETLRRMINQDEIISLHSVMFGMARLMHFPHHTTQYDMDLYVLPHFQELANDIELGRVQAFTGRHNPHHWEEHYVRTADALAAFDIPAMPCASEGFEVYSRYDAHRENIDRRDPRDFRRAFLVAIGEAAPYSDAVQAGTLQPYETRSPEEWERYFEHRRQMAQMAKPITDGMYVWEWADKLWKALEKYDINNDGQPRPPSTDDDDQSDPPSSGPPPDSPSSGGSPDL